MALLYWAEPTPSLGRDRLSSMSLARVQMSPSICPRVIGLCLWSWVIHFSTFVLCIYGIFWYFWHVRLNEGRVMCLKRVRPIKLFCFAITGFGLCFFWHVFWFIIIDTEGSGSCMHAGATRPSIRPSVLTCVSLSPQVQRAVRRAARHQRAPSSRSFSTTPSPPPLQL